MDLFNTDGISSLLPYDGIAEYHGPAFSRQECLFYFDQLRDTVQWTFDEVVLFGRRIVTKRMVAWYGDRDYPYTYSHTTRHALPWTPHLSTLKSRVEELSGEQFNSCLLNLYHNGDEGMGWHSDDESSIVAHSAIASLSFGASRKFLLRHKLKKETVTVQLENGSLLVMKGRTQANWLHCLPKTKKVFHPRINLTFRKMVH